MATVKTQQRDYSLGIRGAVRALWKGLIDADQFYDWMNATIWRGLTGAWYSGAAELGYSRPNCRRRNAARCSLSWLRN